MKSIKIGISMEDHQYAQALIRGLTQIYDGIAISFAGDKPSETYDLIMLEGNAEYDTTARKIILSPDPKQRNIEQMTLFKYQGSKSLLDDLLFLLSKDMGLSFNRDGHEKKKVVGFYSQEGGAGVTSIAISTAYHLGISLDIPTIYINVEPTNSSARYLNVGNKKEMKLLLYMSHKGSKVDLRKYIGNDQGIDYFQSSEVNYFSTFYLDNVRFLMSILKDMDYQILIIDMGNGREELFREMKKMCNETYKVGRPEDQIDQSSLDEKTILNRVDFESGLQGRLIVHEDPEGFCKRDGNVEINNYSAFSSDTKKIAQEVAHGLPTEN